MAFEDDLATALASVASPIYLSTKAQIPAGDGPYLSIVSTGGSSPEYVQNAVAPAYRKPAAQITARAKTFPAARAMALSAWNVLAALRNVSIGGTFYRSIKVMQEPFDGGDDDKARPTVKFNVIAD